METKNDLIGELICSLNKSYTQLLIFLLEKVKADINNKELEALEESIKKLFPNSTPKEVQKNLEFVCSINKQLKDQIHIELYKLLKELSNATIKWTDIDKENVC